MEFYQPENLPLLELTTQETTQLRSSYPNIAHLEAGNAASWLQERHDQLLVRAQRCRAEMNLAKLVGLAGTVIGSVCYATSPLAPIGAIICAIGYVWSIGMDLNDSHRFAPIPFVRDNLFDFVSAMGDAEAREAWLAQKNEIADLMFHLNLLERYEFAMLREFHSVLTSYLEQVEPGKCFYAYRWLLDRFVDFKGSLPDQNSLNKHLETVKPDPRINYQAVQAIAEQRPRIVSIPEPKTIALPESTEPLQRRIQDVTPAHTVISQPARTPQIEAMLKLPLPQRADAISKALIKGGFKIDEVMSSQVIAIAGTQRGGKGTLAAILATLSKAYDEKLNVQYFTAGVDVYPFACNLHSGLKHPGKDNADELVARDLLLFLKGLEASEPYSHKNLLLVIDEAMRLLSLMEESDRIWALQFLLSRFAKTGATLIIVLHASNLSSIAGKATAGLAATFKEGVEFVGCAAKPVSAGGLRKMNVASGAYFKANPDNFGTAVSGGELGSIPEWLKTEKHPGNGQPDPARTLLKFFPELLQTHSAANQDALSKEERMTLQQAIQNINKDSPQLQKFTIFKVNISEALKLINDLRLRNYQDEQIISMLWQVQPETPEWITANEEYEKINNQ